MCCNEPIELKLDKYIQRMILYRFQAKYFVETEKKIFALISVTDFAHPLSDLQKLGWPFFQHFSCLESRNMQSVLPLVWIVTVTWSHNWRVEKFSIFFSKMSIISKVGNTALAQRCFWSRRAFWAHHKKFRRLCTDQTDKLMIERHRIDVTYMWHRACGCKLGRHIYVTSVAKGLISHTNSNSFATRKPGAISDFTVERFKCRYTHLDLQASLFVYRVHQNHHCRWYSS